MIHAQHEVLRNVGDIPFDPALDTLGFEPCHEDMTFEYYSFSDGILYDGEKAQLIREFQNSFIPGSASQNGYITVRFMVNCEGKSGRFRVIELDQDYNKKEFDHSLVNQIVGTTQSLDGWKPGEYESKTYDYYQYLTFKISEGHIVNIMP